MFTFLKRRFKPSAVPASVSESHVAAGLSRRAIASGGGAMPWADVPRYPPIDPGLPAVPVGAVVASQGELIDRLRHVAGFDEASFEHRCLMPIEGVARYIHLLPASGFEHFAGPGGLFRLCIEMALYSRQAAEDRVFVPSASAEMRRQFEPRCKYACFLAGLLTELHRPLGAMVVTDGAGRTWPAFLGSLDAWLRATGAGHYHVAWFGRPMASASAEGAAVFGDIVPKGALSWLNEASPGLVSEVFGAALGQSVPGVGVSTVLQATRQRVFHVEASTRRSRYGQLRIGHHLELHLIDAIRHRVAAGLWRANAREGPLWFGSDGLFLEWPLAAGTIREDVLRNGVTGIPLCAFTLADVLGRAGMLTEASPSNWLWRLHAGQSQASRCQTAVKFADPSSVLGYTEVMPADCSFGAPQPGEGIQRPVAGRPAIPPGLAPAEARMADTLRRHLDSQRPDLLAWLPSGGLAVSQDLLALAGTDLASAAAALHHRRWLGRGDWPSPEARAGLMAFSGTLKPGLVLNEAGARHLGLLSSEG